MKPSFPAFDPVHEEPEVCDICSSDLPAFSYEFDTYGTRKVVKEKMGFCCSNCVTKLRRTLEYDESQEGTGGGSRSKSRRLGSFRF